MCKVGNNKSIETKYYNNYFVITTIRDGVLKYISKDWYKKHAWHYTIKLHKARKFRNIEMAKRFMNEFNIEGDIIKCGITEEVIGREI